MQCRMEIDSRKKHLQELLNPPSSNQVTNSSFIFLTSLRNQIERELLVAIIQFNIAANGLLEWKGKLYYNTVQQYCSTAGNVWKMTLKKIL